MQNIIKVDQRNMEQKENLRSLPLSLSLFPFGHLALVIFIFLPHPPLTLPWPIVVVLPLRTSCPFPFFLPLSLLPLPCPLRPKVSQAMGVFSTLTRVSSNTVTSEEIEEESSSPDESQRIKAELEMKSKDC